MACSFLYRMTTGTRNKLIYTTVSNNCSSNAKLVNGSTSTWTGGDSRLSGTSRGPKGPSREVRLLAPGMRRHIGRALELDRLEEEPLKGNIFSRTLKSRETGPTPTGSAVGVNNFSKSWSRHVQIPLTYGHHTGGATYTGSVNECGFAYSGSTGLPFTADDQYKLIGKLRTRIMGSDFNLGSTLGAEGLDTVRYVADVAQRVYRSAIQVKKLNFPGAFDILREWGRGYNTKTVNGQFAIRQEDIYRELLRSGLGPRKGDGLVDWRDLPRLYLEYQLAVAPLLGDMVAGAQQLAWLTHAPRVQRVTAQVKKTSGAPRPYTGGLWLGSVGVRRRVIAYFTHNPNPFDFSGFQDPEVILWNALPLSFVADYAYNIGGFLEARGTANAMPPAVYVTTTKQFVEVNRLVGRLFQGGPNTLIRSGQGQEYGTGSIVRSISTALEVPRPVFKPFGALEPWRRALTTCSLIALIGDRLPSRFYRE